MATNLNLDTLKVDSSGRASFSGLGSGIDIQGTVDAIIEAKRIPIDRIEQRISGNQAKVAALNDLNGLALNSQGRGRAAARGHQLRRQRRHLRGQAGLCHQQPRRQPDPVGGRRASSASR